MQPLVSIIIPTYNRASLIGNTLNSILAQTYESWECIVVDDGSIDDTQAVIKEFTGKDSRILFFERPLDKLKGANACRNFGLEQSKGAFIQWFDSDDLMHPETLEVKVSYANKNSADIIVSTHCQENVKELPSDPATDVFSKSDFFIDYILGKRPVVTDDVMVKKSVIGRVRYDEQLQKAQEYEFFSRLFEQPLTYCFINVPLTVYKKSANSISGKSDKVNVGRAEALIYLSEKLQKRFPQHFEIIEKTKYQGRKTYTYLAKHRALVVIFNHFTFFKNAFKKNTMLFFFYVCYNFITGRGFDKMKPRYREVPNRKYG